jgi:predicted GNAT superfamily acetyltransferase
VKLRAAVAADADAILAINAESVAVLSPLSRERLAQLEREAAVRRVVEDDGTVVAFLLAFREGAAYDSLNYRWFARRYDRFLYVDRVVVSSAARGRGAGALLYRDVFGFAATHAVGLVTCEYDVEPPNPASGRFHARFGFREVGRQRLDGGKLVSLQAAPVPGRAIS